MAQLVVLATNSAVPAPGLASAPTVRIRRLDTDALVVTDAALTDVGDGLYRYGFSPTDGIEYGWRVDLDPAAAGQVTAGERYRYGVLSGTGVARIETDVPAILADTSTTIPALFGALNDLSSVDVQAAMTAQGYTVARAAALDFLDAAISTRAVPGDAMTLAAGAITAAVVATDAIDADALATDAVTEINVAVLAAIAALNDLAQSDVLSDATPFAGARIDAAISSRAVAGDAMTLTAGEEAAIADAVLDEPLAGHVAAGSLGAGVARLYGDNTRTKLYYADALITGGREVPALAVSHMEVDVKDEGGSFPGTVYYVVFNYQSGDASTDSPRSSSVQSSAPVDGIFSSVAYP